MANFHPIRVLAYRGRNVFAHLPLIHGTKSLAFDSSHVLCRGHFPTAEESVTRVSGVCAGPETSARARVKESPLCTTRTEPEGRRQNARGH